MTRKSDYDTETGLPRKTISKWAVWSMGVLQAIAVCVLLHMLRVQEKQAADIADLRVSVAKIHGLLQVSTSKQPSEFVARGWRMEPVQ